MTWKERKAESRRLMDEHRTKMAEKYGVPESHPKLDKCYKLAWEYGHSAGFQEVEHYFADFVELIRD